MKSWVKMSSPAAANMSVCDTSAVDPKPSSGTSPATTVGASFVLTKFVAASVDSMIRSSSLPPATLAPWDGTMYGSPAVECSAVAGNTESALTVKVGTPRMAKPSAVCVFISFSIHDPEG